MTRAEALAAAASVAVALALFHWMFGLQLALAAHPYWIEPRGDMATMMAGVHAVNQAPWGFPPTVSESLRWPQPVSIVFTDSIPWFTLALKALNLDGVLNPLGAFLLLSFLLQPLGMIAVLRASGVQRAAPLLLGACLALLLPAWLNRQFGHIALCGHWIILFSLALAIASAREGLKRGRIAGFAALATMAAGVHPYFLIPVGALFGSAALAELLQRRPGAPGRVLVAGAVVAGCVGLAALVLGYDVGRGPSSGGQALGRYSMNILGPVWPQASALAGQRWNGGWFTGVLDPTGGQKFEGLNYLGGGVLVLLGCAALFALLRRREGSGLARFGPLCLALAALTLIAIGPVGYAGTSKVWDIPRPDGWLGELVGNFWAHGRFFWAAAYALVALAVVQVAERASARVGATLLAAALALQAYDAHRMIEGLRSSWRQPAPPPYDAVMRTSPVFAGKVWRFVPVFECLRDEDARMVAQLSMLAIRRGGASDSAPIARPLTTDCRASESLLEAGPPPGQLVVVVAHPGEGDRLLKRLHGRGDCYAIKRGAICGQGLAAVPGLRRLEAPDRWKTVAAWRADQGKRPPVLGQGWSITEPRGIWSDGSAAVLRFPASLAEGSEMLRVEIEGGVMRTPTMTEQRVQAYLGERRLAEWSMGDGRHSVDVPVLKPGEDIVLTLRLPDATAPADVYPGLADRRRLGIGLRSVTVRR